MTLCSPTVQRSNPLWFTFIDYQTGFNGIVSTTSPELSKIALNGWTVALF
jgi:hypothetical protein